MRGSSHEPDDERRTNEAWALLSERLELASMASRTGRAHVSLLVIRVHPRDPATSLRASDIRHLDEVAYERVARALERTDTLARQEPLRFVALLERLDEGAYALHTADGIVGAIRRPFRSGRHSVKLVASVGVSVYPDDGRTLTALLGCAESALTAAEMSGGDLFGFYSGELNEAANRRITLERALGDAVEREQLSVHYQPQIDNRDGTLVGLEALLRWHHPTLGNVSPAEFVPILETLGLIERVGAWVLEQACHQAAFWTEAARPIRLGVNVSAHQLRRPDFGQVVRHALDASGLPPEQLELELTESVLLEDSPEVRDTLDGLRAAGVRIALDDFGTGYASLAYIRQFPMDELKIDRQFVKGLPVDAQNAAITSAIVALAHALGLELVAEGVETEAEEEFLHSLGCFTMQGYRYARPMTPEMLLEWRATRPWA